MKKGLLGVLARALLILISFNSGATPQEPESSATLKDTLDFVEQMVKTHGNIDFKGDRDVYTFATSRCEAKITLNRQENGTKFSLINSFKLSDLDPESTRVETNFVDERFLSSVILAMTSHKQTISTQREMNGRVDEIIPKIEKAFFWLKDSKDGENAKRVARALKHAIQLLAARLTRFELFTFKEEQ